MHPHMRHMSTRITWLQVSKHADTILSNATIKRLIGDKCDGVIGQLTEVRENKEEGQQRGGEVG